MCDGFIRTPPLSGEFIDLMMDESVVWGVVYKPH